VIVVSDTSPLRGLLSIGKLDLLKSLFDRVLIPNAVFEELSRIKALNVDINSILNYDWIQIKDIREKDKLITLSKYLDQGESEAILLAKESKCDLILMDESRGRKIAKSLNLEVLGLIGILVLAKQKGFLNEIKSILYDLRENYGFWIKEEFLSIILKSVNEL
jgi:predicted nucleic acid-binding protein